MLKLCSSVRVAGRTAASGEPGSGTRGALLDSAAAALLGGGDARLRDPQPLLLPAGALPLLPQWAVRRVTPESSAPARLPQEEDARALQIPHSITCPSCSHLLVLLSFAI